MPRPEQSSYFWNLQPLLLGVVVAQLSAARALLRTAVGLLSYCNEWDSTSCSRGPAQLDAKKTVLASCKALAFLQDLLCSGDLRWFGTLSTR